MARKASSKPESSATIGFEAKLWLTADKLRNNMDAAEYKHVVLGLIFLKYNHLLVPQGLAGFGFPNCSMPSNQSGEKETWLPS